MQPITYEIRIVAFHLKMNGCRNVLPMPSVANVGYYNRYLCYRNAFCSAIRWYRCALTTGRDGSKEPSCDAPATDRLWEPAIGIPCLSR